MKLLFDYEISLFGYKILLLMAHTIWYSLGLDHCLCTYFQ